MIFRRDNPVGVDSPIDKCQVILGRLLSWDVDIYSRLYMNTKDGGVIAEAFTEGREYIEVFVDDRRAKIGFVVEPERVGSTIQTATVNVVVSADVEQVYGTREDEALMLEVVKVLTTVPGWRVESVKSGNISEIFSFMDYGKLIYRDMQPFVNFSVRCKVNYFNNICNIL
jgi:hypothetical protein